jgi:transposase
VRQVRDLPSAGFRIVLELDVRRVACRRCGTVKRERLDFLADNPHFTKRFAFYVGRRCRQASIRDVAKELKLDWDTVKTLEMQYMRAQRAGTPGPRAIGIDEISVAGATAIASWSATWFASGRSGSAARIVPRPA